MFSPRMKKYSHDKHVLNVLKPQSPTLEYQPIPLSHIKYEHGTVKKSVKSVHKARYSMKNSTHDSNPFTSGSANPFTPGLARGGPLFSPGSGHSSFIITEY